MSQPAATDQGVRSVSSTFHHFPWPKITQTYKIWWGKWEMGVPRNLALIIFANCFQVKSSYKLSWRIPRDYSDDDVLKLANN